MPAALEQDVGRGARRCTSSLGPVGASKNAAVRAAAMQDPLRIATRSFPSAVPLVPELSKRLPSSAQALLIPSSAEGYGLPIVEALATGVPRVRVTTSAVPVFSEIGVGRLLIINPADGSGGATRRLRGERLSRKGEWPARSEDYAAPEWKSFFASIEDSVINLKHRT